MSRLVCRQLPAIANQLNNTGIKMTLSIVPNNGNEDSDRSPFDAIRGYKENGTEYWTGRELMRWLGFGSVFDCATTFGDSSVSANVNGSNTSALPGGRWNRRRKI